jgi:1-aminocyclopropane-1-carboxylate deaminase/D-cysteine desulfhydrase-like pyridoxal-dependent ACC family enzyme
MILNHRSTRYALLFVIAQISLFATSTYSLSARCHAINDWMETNVDRSSNPKLFSSSEGVALFEAIPNLKARLPYINFAQLPTPVSKLEKFGAAVAHPSLYMKNDAHTGTRMGGNKIRKLCFLLGWALFNKAELVLTCGGAGSNHSTATIDCAQQVDLPCMSFLSPQIPTSYARRNLLVSKALGGDLQLCESFNARQQAILDYATTHDRKIFYISAGGSSARGSLGFVNAAFELAQQVRSGQIPEPDLIVVGAGSNGTAAGLSLGLALAGLKTEVLAVCTTGLTPSTLEADTKELHAGMLKILGVPAPTNLKLPYYADDYYGGTYALVTPKTIAASTLMFSTEDLNLDVTYAGKALGAFYDLAREAAFKDKNLLFWNTFCNDSLEEITSKVDYHTLPEKFHHYFTDPLQVGDLGFASHD